MSEPADAKKRPRSLGRRIALGIYWLLMVYMMVVGFYSVVTQVFWPPRTGATAAADCLTSIRTLHDELLEQASSHITADGASDDPASIEAWFARWDDRYHSLEGQCGDRHVRARRNLLRLRHRVESVLRGFDRDVAGLARAVEQNLPRISQGAH